MTCLLFMRIWCSNYRNMQYWLGSDHILIINPSYDVHHVHESQSDGMDHQWFQNTILTDIIKMTFLHIISHIYYYHLSPWYIHDKICLYIYHIHHSLTFDTLTSVLMITFFQQIILSLYFSCGFCGTNQIVSIFLLFLMVKDPNILTP